MKPDKHDLNLVRQVENPSIRVLKRDEGEDDDHVRVELSFSSETPVRQWWGMEILDHGKDAADLSRLNDGGAVLVNHDWHDQVAVVEKAWIGEDQRGYTQIRFSRSDRGKEIAQDVIDGIRTLVSVGYRVLEIVQEKGGEDEDDVYRIMRWEPFEISIVSVPADPTVGVGRAFEKRFGGEAEQAQAFRELTRNNHSDHEENQMKNESTAPAADPAVDIEAQRTAAANAERTRVSRILQLGSKYDMTEAAERAVSEGMDLNDFRDEVFSQVEERIAKGAPKTRLDMTEGEQRSYSLMRAIRAAHTGNWKDAGLEREASEAIAQRLGRDPNGFFVPHDIQSRTQNVTTPADGGALVAQNLQAGSFIELLYANSALIGFGAQTLEGLVGNVDIPRRTAGAAFEWVAEDGAATNSDSAFDLVQLTPKTITAGVPITRRAMLQITPSIDALVLSDMAVGAALGIDAAGLAGTGASNQPRGIVNTTGVNTSAVSTAGQPTYAEMVAFETAVDTDNALLGNLAYVTTPAVRGHLRTQTVDSGSGVFLVDRVGYDVRTTSQLAANTIIFGNYADVLIGMWGVLDLMVDRATKAASGGVVLRAFQDVDVAVRHPESFCINA